MTIEELKRLSVQGGRGEGRGLGSFGLIVTSLYGEDKTPHPRHDIKGTQAIFEPPF